MKKKDKLLKECAEVLKKDYVAKWYAKNMETTGQYYTVNVLEHGVHDEELTVRDALYIALIVGVQWKEKFEGVP